jgi:hypothetical protein
MYANNLLTGTCALLSPRKAVVPRWSKRWFEKKTAWSSHAAFTSTAVVTERRVMEERAGYYGCDAAEQIERERRVLSAPASARRTEPDEQLLRPENKREAHTCRHEAAAGLAT